MDTDGLSPAVTAEGGKSWHFRYCWNGKQKRLSLGTYPEISLKEARTRRDLARELVARGVNPRKQRNHERRLALLTEEHTFRKVAGALSAWQALRDAIYPGPLGNPLIAALTHGPITKAMNRMSAMVQTILPAGTRDASVELLDENAQQSAVWQAFELRNGLFYEPSPVLHRLLETARIADNVPLGMISLPCDTLCILPRGNDGEVQSERDELIVIFRNDLSIEFLAWARQPSTDGNSARGNIHHRQGRSCGVRFCR